MVDNRSSRFGLWIALVLVLIIALAAGVFVSLRPHLPEVVKEPAPPPKPVSEQTPLNPKAVESWKAFVSSARAKCREQGPNCTLDYASIHQYGAQSFGVMVVAWKDSEYVIDLFRYDPAKNDWTVAPTKQTEMGSEQIDTASASKNWKVPRNLLDEWISKAESALRRRYGGG